jgi:hypothetical protein
MYYLIELALVDGLNNYALYDTNIITFAKIINNAPNIFLRLSLSLLIIIPYIKAVIIPK